MILEEYEVRRDKNGQLPKVVCIYNVWYAQSRTQTSESKGRRIIYDCMGAHPGTALEQWNALVATNKPLELVKLTELMR